MTKFTIETYNGMLY